MQVFITKARKSISFAISKFYNSTLAICKLYRCIQQKKKVVLCLFPGIFYLRNEIKRVNGEFVAACPIRHSWLDLREESRLRRAVFRNPAKDLPHVPRQRRRSVEVSVRGNGRSEGWLEC